MSGRSRMRPKGPQRAKDPREPMRRMDELARRAVSMATVEAVSERFVGLVMEQTAGLSPADLRRSIAHLAVWVRAAVRELPEEARAEFLGEMKAFGEHMDSADPGNLAAAAVLWKAG